MQSGLTGFEMTLVSTVVRNDIPNLNICWKRAADLRFHQWARGAVENHRFQCLRVLVLHQQQRLLDTVWSYLNDFPVLSTVLTCSCDKLIKGRQGSDNSKRWLSLTNQELRDYLAPYGLTSADESWDSLLCSVYHSGEPYFAKLCDTKLFKKVAQSPILHIALGSSVIETGNDLILFKRTELGGTRKERTRDTTTHPRQDKTKKTGLVMVRVHQDISSTLDAFQN